MPASPRSRLKMILCWLLPAAVFVFGFGFGWVGDVAASSVVKASTFDINEHARHCGCGRICKGQSCCCGSKKPKDIVESDLPADLPDSKNLNPCLNRAPCQIPGLPPTSSVGPVSKAVMLASCEHFMLSSSQRRFDLPSPCVLPERQAARLDDPPESPSFG